MKFLTLVFAILYAMSTGAWAQQFSDSKVNQTNRNNLPRQGNTFQTQSSKKVIPLKPISPQPTGVLVDIYQKGPVMVSPTAPLSLGYGQRNFTPPVPSYANTGEFRRLPREAGGIKLGGWNF